MKPRSRHGLFISTGRFMAGQALVESILACAILIILLFGASWVWNFGEYKQQSVEAVRYATWERATYASAPQEVYSMGYTDADLAKDTFKKSFLTPSGMEADFNNSLGTNGNSSLDSGNYAGNATSWLNKAGQLFMTVTGNTATSLDALSSSVTVASTSSETNSNGGAGPMGFDPTGHTLTNLDLDRNTVQKVTVNGKVGFTDFINKYLLRRIGIVPSTASPLGTTTDTSEYGSMTIVGNSWGAPSNVALQRIVLELNPLAPRNPVGFAINNPVAFNVYQLLGGKDGFAGNYRVDMPGLSAAGLSALPGDYTHGNSWETNLNNTDSAINVATSDYKENFNMNPFGQLETAYASVKCTPMINGQVGPAYAKLKATQQIQDPTCPGGKLRSRTIAPFDNQAWKYQGPMDGLPTVKNPDYRFKDGAGDTAGGGTIP